ncbi:MAG: peptidylprolyl isomerase [Ideonella sp.]|nr:peptidylprolyl isomerase [Ideonella sp.]
MFRRIAAAFLVVSSMAANAQVPDSTPIIEAAGQSITKGEFELMLAEDVRLARAKSDPAVMKALGQEMGRAFALEAEARKRKLDQSAAVQLRIRNYTTQLLANQLLLNLRRGYLKDEAALAAHYEKTKDAWAQPRVRQILVRMKGSEVALRKGKPDLSLDQAKAKATALVAKLAGGADFAALAKADSDDLGTIASGGDMGFVNRGSTDGSFEGAAFSLPVGKVSDPIQTRFGFHIIRVEERRPMGFAALKPALANEMAHQEMDRLIQNGFKTNPDYFGQ